MADLSRHAQLLLDVATQEAKRRGHNPVSPIHLVAGLIRRDRDVATTELGDQAVQDVATAMKRHTTAVLETLSIEQETTDVLATIDSEPQQWEVVRAGLPEWLRQSAESAGGDASSAADTTSDGGEGSSATTATAAVAAEPELVTVIAAFVDEFDGPTAGVLASPGGDTRWNRTASHQQAMLDDAWHIACAIARADGSTGEPELAVLSSAFATMLHDGTDPAELARTHAVPPAFGQPSVVLRALVARDRRDGSAFARRYALRLVEIGRLVASHDAGVAPEEARLLDELRVVVRSELAAVPTRALDPVAAVNSAEPSKVDAVLTKLDALVGLESVKREIRARLEWFRINDLRRRRGLATEPQSLHMAFLGNPGTGKTTVARLVGELFAAAGALRKGHLVEADRSKFVAQYLGQTSHLVNETVNKASGGVLFIDEAYSLAAASMVGQSGDSYEREAVDTLVKLMEDRRDDLIVIVAGYTQPMEHFLRSNEGLASRVPVTLHFDDYDDAELIEVFRSMVALNGRVVTPDAEAAVVGHLQHGRTQANFGNARAVRNVLEAAMRQQAVRLADHGDLATDDELATIEAVDIPAQVVTAVDRPDPRYL
jgi:hypothetical protein